MLCLATASSFLHFNCVLSSRIIYSTTVVLGEHRPARGFVIRNLL